MYFHTQKSDNKSNHIQHNEAVSSTCTDPGFKSILWPFAACHPLSPLPPIPVSCHPSPVLSNKTTKRPNNKNVSGLKHLKAKILIRRDRQNLFKSVQFVYVYGVLHVRSIFQNIFIPLVWCLTQGLLSLDWQDTCSPAVPNGETTCATQLVSAAVKRLQTPHFRGASRCCRPNILVLVQCDPHWKPRSLNFKISVPHKQMYWAHHTAHERIFICRHICIKSMSSHDYNELQGLLLTWWPCDMLHVWKCF